MGGGNTSSPPMVEGEQRFFGAVPPHGGGGTELFWGCSPSMVGGATGHILDTFFCHLFPPHSGGGTAPKWENDVIFGRKPPKIGPKS